MQLAQLLDLGNSFTSDAVQLNIFKIDNRWYDMLMECKVSLRSDSVLMNVLVPRGSPSLFVRLNEGVFARLL